MTDNGQQPAADQRPIVDPGNPHAIGGYPSALTTGQVGTPQGPALVLTIRSGPGTLTVLLAKDDAKAWAARIDAEAHAMSALIVAPAGAIPPLNGQRR